jgi:hypothetical protein
VASLPDSPALDHVYKLDPEYEQTARHRDARSSKHEKQRTDVASEDRGKWMNGATVVALIVVVSVEMPPRVRDQCWRWRRRRRS